MPLDSRLGVEPEDDFWIHSDDFRSVKQISKDLVSQYPESGMLHSHPVAQKRHDHALELRSIQDAIRKILESHQARPENCRFYVSYPALVNEYWVSMVLSLQDDIVASYRALRRSTVQLHEHRSFPVPVTLTQAVAEQFLRYASEELRKPEPCMPESTDSDQLVRKAGAAMAEGVVLRTSDHGNDLFRDCLKISSLRYERSAGLGRILLAAKDHPAIKHKVIFEAPVKLRNYRAARKLLQLSFDGILLHSDSERIFGLATVSEYDGMKEDLFEVRFVDHHHWELRHEDRPLMTVHYGVPALPKPQFDEQAIPGAT